MLLWIPVLHIKEQQVRAAGDPFKDRRRSAAAAGENDAADDAKYKAIGESDRMTLRFVKPRRD